MIISLGVVDIPYSDGGKTTGDVAEILEDKYGVMRTFWDVHGQEIADLILEAKVAAFESNEMGAQFEDEGMYLAAMEAAKVLFSEFITMREMDGLANGVPTKASLMGVSHRFKNKRGVPGRPSFVDTGLMLASFMAWIELDD